MEIYFLTTIHESKSDLQTQQEPDFLHLSASLASIHWTFIDSLITSWLKEGAIVVHFGTLSHQGKIGCREK